MRGRRQRRGCGREALESRLPGLLDSEVSGTLLCRLEVPLGQAGCSRQGRKVLGRCSDGGMETAEGKSPARPHQQLGGPGRSS